MAFIVTHPTDQHPVKYGYCVRCYTYNEVWRKDKRTECSKCKKKMIHISSWKIFLLLAILCFTFLLGCKTEEKPVEMENVKVTGEYPKSHQLMKMVDPGLHLVEINDSTQILIYRGVESCTMLQLK